MDMTWLFPAPEPVDVGARTLRACSLMLKDLAHLQAYVKAKVRCPLADFRASIAASAEGSERRRRALRDAYNACEAWPVRLGSEEGQAILNSEDGFRFWLLVVLGRDNPALAPADYEELAATITVPQYQELMRVCYAASPLQELARLITPDSFGGARDGPTNWGKVIRSLIVETGWTFEQCATVRLCQLAAFQSDGEAAGGKVSPPPGMTHYQFSRRQKRFFGPDREEDC